MKKTLFASYLDGIKGTSSGTSYSSILRYFLPELVTASLLYVALSVIDGMFIAHLKGSTAYATVSITNTLFHFLTKIAESFSVGTLVLVGQYNGAQEYKKAGSVVADAFWTTCILGGLVALLLYCAAYPIYAFYQMPQEMVELGVPFVQLRSIGVFFSFVFLALVGFLRGIKNTQVPMMLFVAGGVIFLFFDYALIFGAFGFQSLGITGSALASVIQYGCMLAGALLYIIFDQQNRIYGIALFRNVSATNCMSLILLSLPVIVDKASLAFSQIWLAKMMGAMTKIYSADLARTMLASFSAIKELERIAILPGIAFAQVITFLVSNDYRSHHWQSIKNNIKKILFLSSCMVMALLAIFSLWPSYFLRWFDIHNAFTPFAAQAIPFLSLLVIFDLAQLILAAALRGAAQVAIVMLARIVITVLFFIPFSYSLCQIDLGNPLLHFVLMYGSMYIGNALMMIVYVNWFRTNKWKKIEL